jgi:hypothetical protein
MTNPAFATGMERDPSHRVDQICNGCGQWDKAPRHHHMAQDPVSGSYVDRSMHMDCCSAAGCPDGTCDRILAEAGDKRNDALVQHVTKMAPGTHVIPNE